MCVEDKSSCRRSVFLFGPSNKFSRIASVDFSNERRFGVVSPSRRFLAQSVNREHSNAIDVSPRVLFVTAFAVVVFVAVAVALFECIDWMHTVRVSYIVSSSPAPPSLSSTSWTSTSPPKKSYCENYEKVNTDFRIVIKLYNFDDTSISEYTQLLCLHL